MNKLKVLVGLAVSAFFLYFTLRGINWLQLWHILQHADYIYLIPGVAVHFIAFYIRSIKLSVLTKKFKQVSANAMFPIVAIGLMMNNILPLRAGEIGRIFLLSNKFLLTKINATLILVMERLFDIAGLLIIVLIFSHFQAWPGYISQLITIASMGILAFIILAPTFITLFTSLMKKSHHSIGKAITEKMVQIKKGYFIFHNPKLIGEVSVLSVLLWFVEGVSYYVISLAFHLSIGLPTFVFISAIVNISSALPSTAGFIGTFEFFATNLLLFFGISKTLALSFVLVLHIELLLPITLVGLYFYFAKRYDKYLTLHHVLENG